jgi:hypothetical protein
MNTDYQDIKSYKKPNIFVLVDSKKRVSWEKGECEKVVKEKGGERITFIQNKA